MGSALALIAVSFVYTSQTQAQIAKNVIEAERAEAMADAMAFHTIGALLASRSAAGGNADVRADGSPHRIPHPLADVVVTVQDEGGLVDLNSAAPDLLAGLFRTGGLDAAAAKALAQRIAAMRTGGSGGRMAAEASFVRPAWLPQDMTDRPFDRVAALKRLPGVSDDLYSRVSPALTVLSGSTGIDPRHAPRHALLAVPGFDPAIVDSIIADRAVATWSARTSRRPLLSAAVWRRFLTESTGRVFRVRASVRTKAGSAFLREAAVEFTDFPERPYAILDWDQGCMDCRR